MWNKEEKRAAYELLLLQQQGLLEMETNWIASLSNSSALLNETLKETVFAGYKPVKFMFGIKFAQYSQFVTELSLKHLGKPPDKVLNPALKIA